jgi:UDPglucose--hexose-1-phosphate uridylyltransferase
MLELRKDYILDRWVIVSEKREKRPNEFKRSEKTKERFCYFCQGNEDTTPKEIGRIEEKGKWIIRWFPNKFPAVSKEGNPRFKKQSIYEHGNAYGYHEIIVETNDHKKQFSDLSKEHITKILKVYMTRIKELSKKKGIKYVLVFKNQGRESGASLLHSHTQIVAYNKIPGLVQYESNKSLNGGKCEYCKIIKKESKSKRFVKQNKNFIAICPYASRFNYEVWIFSKKHINSTEEFNEKQLIDLAEILRYLLVKVAKITDSYNFVIHQAPKGKDLHFHIEICPRIAKFGGFELVSGEIINSISPERATKYYK